jgi:two-component system chemotaxis response regulator CheY
MMRILIVDDSFLTREILHDLLAPYGDCSIAVNGEEALQAVELSLEKQNPYQLICMDIKMPVLNGDQALVRIRELEKAAGIPPAREAKVIMTTGCDDPKTVINSYYHGGATSYLVKPFTNEALLAEMKKLGLFS